MRPAGALVPVALAVRCMEQCVTDDLELLIAEMARALHAPWMSEHLSFNRAANHGCEFNTGFLLPPRQTAAVALWIAAAMPPAAASERWRRGMKIGSSGA